MENKFIDKKRESQTAISCILQSNHDFGYFSIIDPDSPGYKRRTTLVVNAQTQCQWIESYNRNTIKIFFISFVIFLLLASLISTYDSNGDGGYRKNNDPNHDQNHDHNHDHNHDPYHGHPPKDHKTTTTTTTTTTTKKPSLPYCSCPGYPKVRCGYRCRGPPPKSY